MGAVQKLIKRHYRQSDDGFTLIELMIVILILAILVGIAVAVMLFAQKRASQATAQANTHIGEKCLDNAWFRCMEGTYTYYRDSNSATLGAGATQYVRARLMSFMEPKINWLDVTVAANRFSVNTAAGYGWYKNKVALTVSNPADMGLAQGKICVTNCYASNAAGTTWAAANTNYCTIITVDTVSHRANFTCYFQGKVTRSGTITMNNDGTISP
jgi:prepilin-type N-terminal cleavage/methylation domain-containing protein